MSNLPDYLYHLTSIYNCREILRSGRLRPRIQDFASCTAVEKCALNPGRFVHLNFCPRSLMLWYIYQGRCWSTDKIYGQGDAVHIEINYYCLMVELGLHEDENVILSDYDFSDKRRTAMVLNVSSCNDDIGNIIDFSEINLSINTIDAEEHPKKGAEIMIDTEIPLCADMVSSIVVRDAVAKARLLQNHNMPPAFANKVFIRSEWYF